MKEITLYLILSFFLIRQINAQEVVSAGGGDFTNSSLSVSWTIGEPITETYSVGSNILTQGFHQSKLSVIGIMILVQKIYQFYYFQIQQKVL